MTKKKTKEDCVKLLRELLDSLWAADIKDIRLQIAMCGAIMGNLNMLIYMLLEDFYNAS